MVDYEPSFIRLSELGVLFDERLLIGLPKEVTKTP